MPAGKHRIATFRMVDKSASFDLNTAFETKPGKVLYIGDIYYTIKGDRTLMTFRVTDESNSVFKELEKKYHLFMKTHTPVTKIIRMAPHPGARN